MRTPPAVVIEPRFAREPVALIGDEGVRSFPAWLYAGHALAPRPVRSAVLYTASGAHDLRPVIETMLAGPAATEIDEAYENDAVTALVDPTALRAAALAEAETAWLRFLDGIR